MNRQDWIMLSALIITHLLMAVIAWVGLRKPRSRDVVMLDLVHRNRLRCHLWIAMVALTSEDASFIAGIVVGLLMASAIIAVLIAQGRGNVERRRSDAPVTTPYARIRRSGALDHNLSDTTFKDALRASRRPEPMVSGGVATDTREGRE